MTDLDMMARELLANCLDDWGHPTEAQNVRSGDDLESYWAELRLIEKLRAYGLLKFAHEPVTAPPGYVLVPAVPTDDMQWAATDEQVGGHCHMCIAWDCTRDDARRVWDAMIAAAPQPKDQTP